jgi:hypothetical protein
MYKYKMSIENGRITKTAPVWQIGSQIDGFSVEKTDTQLSYPTTLETAVGPVTIAENSVVASAPVMETKVIFFEQNADGTSGEFFLSANKLKEITDNISTAASNITSIQAILSVDDTDLDTLQELSTRLKTIVEDPDSGAKILQNIVEIELALDAAETANTAAISAETTRAQAAESGLSTDISAETARATAAETTNATAIIAETTRAQTAETANATAITAEASRAQTAEGVNATAISDETSRALGVESMLSNRITSEATTARLATESEASRATAAEGVNATAIAAEATTARAAESANATAITAEVTRATTAEQANTDAIEQLQLNSGGAVLYSNEETGRIPDLSLLDPSSPVKILSKISAEWFFIAITNLSSADIILAHVTDKSKNDIKDYLWTWSDFDALQSQVYHGTPTPE